MALETKVQLWSRKTKSAHEVERGEKRTKKKIRRRVANGCAGDSDGEGKDACADLFEAAQYQLKEEMKAAGMEGILPMSFGSRPKSKTSRNCKRSLGEITEQEGVDEAVGEGNNSCDGRKVEEGEDGEDNPAVDDDKQQLSGEESVKTETTVVDKVRVVYDSDGEIAERVVEKVEMVVQVKPEEQSTHERASKSPGRGKKRHKCPASKDMKKYYMQRHLLFKKFDEGIQLDNESWYSVTPQAIAEHIAMRLSCDVVVDPFAGCGGNVIQLARTCKQVIAIDIDPEKIRMAKHNAAIYGVADKIEWVVGNSIDILPKLRADAVFLSPPWGGISYDRKRFRLENMLVKGVSGLDIYAMARKVSKNIVYYLPKSTLKSDLEALAPGEPVECEYIFLNEQLKVVAAYYGELATPEKQGDEKSLLDEDKADT